MSDKQRVKLIALDMDGTLLTPEHEVSERNKKAIQNAMEQGIDVILSTGRSWDTCFPFAEELGLSSYLITANGGQIWTVEKELLQEHLLKTETVEKMYLLAREKNMHCWMISTEKVFRGHAPDNLYDHQWLKFGCASEDKNKLDQMIKELSYNEELELTNSLPTNIEINPKGVSKAQALKFLCEKIGITMDNVMAVGDSLNDIKMIQESGVGVAMGNAQVAIKKVANYTTDTNEEDGVGKAIEKYAL
ncbi:MULTISPECIES: Cof-type HAD-IIB family hydrolase [Oceanobacillus]|uniref:Cof-type HAD-IIB family hydrolase n=1 Tax=Oceanobacillus TaxID=182709 RepID=UPI001BEA58A1|nr:MULTISPECIES: Cof-type HAD-IIB family hydrolase [Oceanobacillus]MBT2600157.1 HAD family phosphatase [Oceanobacillus sp. ISL-74]MBT2650315.1 HAD family phosphatase [Oceanobacillus sp. ISL-73]MCT1578058.1 Cof-type HAD-IIB family hydrolase [Oceanobacillus kimchii]MCT2137618.1 Cof-type HAD-IIB family hydrolase [Oceanobacillus kimchii]